MGRWWDHFCFCSDSLSQDSWPARVNRLYKNKTIGDWSSETFWSQRLKIREYTISMFTPEKLQNESQHCLSTSTLVVYLVN